MISSKNTSDLTQEVEILFVMKIMMHNERN